MEAGTSASGRRAGDLVVAGAGRPKSGAHGDFESAMWRFRNRHIVFFGASQFLGCISKPAAREENVEPEKFGGRWLFEPRSLF